MRRTQCGLTMIGFLIAAAIAGLIIFAAMRLVPVYLEHMKIVSVLEALKEEHAGNSPSIAELRVSIQRRLDVEDVRVVKLADFKIANVSGGQSVQVQYEHTVPYIANVWLQVRFDNSVEISN